MFPLICVSDIFTKPDLVCVVCHDKLWCSLFYLAVSKHPLTKVRHSETYGEALFLLCSVHTLCRLISCKGPTNNLYEKGNSL